MSDSITASMLYDLVSCPHRVTMDAFGDPAKRDKTSAFVQMLWERGSLFEKETIRKLAQPVLDLSMYAGDEKAQRTAQAMDDREPLIYSGRIQIDNLLGDPDLLRLSGDDYIAGDIKSGRAEEGTDDNAKPKIHYGVQLGLYTDILHRQNRSRLRRAFIWDIQGDEVEYDFDAPYGTRSPRTLWQDYEAARHFAEKLIDQRQKSTPAYGSQCKLCHWYSTCLSTLKRRDDLTLIAELGRSKRDAMINRVETIQELADADVAAFQSSKGKTLFAGIGSNALARFYERAVLLKSGAGPYLREPVSLRPAQTELFFDIEVDPMRDLCYLHGFIERHNQDNGTEKYVPFFTTDVSPAAERQAFADALAYIRTHAGAIIYYYSKYERTIYRKLAAKYPQVCDAETIETLFDPSRSVDLYYDVVKKATEWPTRDYSIKTLARYLGFKWRDNDPSGAASIEWFDRWVREEDPSLRQRILDYNEDDCRATRVLLDGVRDLQ